MGGRTLGGERREVSAIGLSGSPLPLRWTGNVLPVLYALANFARDILISVAG